MWLCILLSVNSSVLVDQNDEDDDDDDSDGGLVCCSGDDVGCGDDGWSFNFSAVVLHHERRQPQKGN